MRGRPGVARQEIECAIARGWDDTRLAEHYRLEDIAATKERLEQYLAEDPPFDLSTSRPLSRHLTNMGTVCAPRTRDRNVVA